MSIATTVLQKIKEHLRDAHSVSGEIIFSPVGGGSINQTFRIQAVTGALFCKINSATEFPQLFEKEKAGLNFLAAQAVISIPAVIDCFEAEGHQVLLLEWIEEGERTESFWKSFGESLASLHQVRAEAFGLNEDNYMGSVPQVNTWQQRWTDFFIQQRLEPLIKKCEGKNLLTLSHRRLFESLFKQLVNIFSLEKPSLLHGDLWSGNFMCRLQSLPVLIDPAIYFGYRSMDLALTTLFGGFAPSFYDAYHYHYPLPVNYKEQWEISNLYPLLIHLYLFGSSYRPQIEQTLYKFR